MLGENVGTPTMMKINPDMMPVLVSSVDIEGKDIFELSDYVNNTLIPAMEKVEGVASVTAMGTVEKNIKVTLDQSKIDELNEKVLSGIDSALAKTQKELKDGEIALKKARTQFENESKTQTEKLINSETEIKTCLLYTSQILPVPFGKSFYYMFYVRSILFH